MTESSGVSMSELAATALQEALGTLAKAREMAEAAVPDAAARAAALVAVGNLYLDIHSVARPED